MFPDSDIAKTKTTNKVTKALAPVAEKKGTKLCREQVCPQTLGVWSSKRL
jgi:hypothetical protein